jgi:hypothetical protein
MSDRLWRLSQHPDVLAMPSLAYLAQVRREVATTADRGAAPPLTTGLLPLVPVPVGGPRNVTTHEGDE